MNESKPPHVVDCETLTAGELRKRYPGEYSSWRNMKSRRTRGEAEIALEFEAFRGFLLEVGPRPDLHEIDRINFRDPLYGPGRVRWLSRKGQANNRSSTIFLMHEGERLPLTVWAERTGQDAARLRKRHERGHSDEEVIYGRQPNVRRPLKRWPGDQSEERLQAWERRYRREALPGETRAGFYIRSVAITIETARQFVEDANIAISYLNGDALPEDTDENRAHYIWETLDEASAEDITRRREAALKAIRDGTSNISEFHASRHQPKR